MFPGDAQEVERWRVLPQEGGGQVREGSLHRVCSKYFPRISLSNIVKKKISKSEYENLEKVTFDVNKD